MRGALLAFAVLFSTLAVMLLLAGSGPRHPLQAQRMMAQLDANQSGWLEADELDGRDPPGFSWRLHDLNHDGRLEARELEVLVEELDPLWVIRMPSTAAR